MFGQCVLLPASVKGFEKKSVFAIKIVVIILCVALFAYRLHGSDLVPYKFFWQ